MGNCSSGKRSQEALVFTRGFYLEVGGCPIEDKRVSIALHLSALEGGTGKELTRLSSRMIKSEILAGNVAIGCNIDPQSNAKGGGKLSRFWFSEWKAKGGMVKARPDLAFGPILYAMHTLSRGTLALTAQMPPWEKRKPARSVLMPRTDRGKWTKQAVAQIDPLSRTATFRVKEWDDSRDVAYRVVFEDRKKDGSAKERYFEGVIRKDPVDKKEVVVAGFTGNKATAFPNSKLVENVRIVNPDALFFRVTKSTRTWAGMGFIEVPLTWRCSTTCEKFIFGAGRSGI